MWSSTEFWERAFEQCAWCRKIFVWLLCLSIYSFWGCQTKPWEIFKFRSKFQGQTKCRLCSTANFKAKFSVTYAGFYFHIRVFFVLHWKKIKVATTWRWMQTQILLKTCLLTKKSKPNGLHCKNLWSLEDLTVMLWKFQISNWRNVEKLSF